MPSQKLQLRCRAATPSARDPNLSSGNHDISRLSAFAYLRSDAPIQDLADIRLAYSQRILGVAPSPLAPRPRPGATATHTHTLLATQTSAVATTTCLDYLHLHACPSDGCAHPWPCRHTSATPPPNGYWVWCPHPSLADQTHTHTTPQRRIYQHPHGGQANYVPASPGDYRQMEHTCMPIAPSGAALLPTDIGCGTALPLAPRPHTATPTACDSNLDSGNHDMSRLSNFAYLNDAPIHALPTYLHACSCSQRILSVVPCPSLPDQIHTTPQHHLN
jgi:hypothetical protein